MTINVMEKEDFGHIGGDIMEEHKHTHENIGNTDEFTIGTPSKGGQVVVKVNWSNRDEASLLIQNALSVRTIMSKKHKESLEEEEKKKE